MMKKNPWLIALAAAIALIASQAATMDASWAGTCGSWCTETGITCSGSYSCKQCLGGHCYSCNDYCKYDWGGPGWIGSCKSSCGSGEFNVGTCPNSTSACCCKCSSPGNCAALDRPDLPLNGLMSPVAQVTTGVMEKVIGLMVNPAYATDLYFGFRDGTNRSGTGVSAQCDARLHVCFTSGIYDSALSGVDTTQECDNACDTNNSPSQIACSYTDCQDRCYCGRANTSCGCN